MATKSNHNGTHPVNHSNQNSATNGIHSLNKRRRTFSEVNSKLPRLPVLKYKDQFHELIAKHDALIIVGETGSGKTTQIPKWCSDFLKSSNNWNKNEKLCVACTQPRRIAAMSVSNRVAKELNVTLGEEVGYSVRFESCLSNKTILKYLTDGMLLREAMLDNTLSDYGFIIIDEAHERTLATEILLGIVKRAMNIRNSDSTEFLPLKVVVMSATINVKLFKDYFNAPELVMTGRQHVVSDFFAEVPQSDLLTSSLITVFQIHRENPSDLVDGDILVFCSGQDEIQTLVTMCKKALKHAPTSMQKLIPLPLYASLPASHQMRVFDRNKAVKTITNDATSTNYRRVIFSTNVAETSVTIPKIKWVIDTGKVKCNFYCPKTGRESLRVIPISKAQANQRSGRAGRVSAGQCYRLYTSDDYEQMQDHLLPEIKRCNLDSVLLQMISIGIQVIGSFDFLERPEDSRIRAALVNLLSLKAIRTIKNPHTSDSPHNKSACLLPAKESQRPSRNETLLNLSYGLTTIGQKLSTFPLSPALGRIILAADELGCLDEALTIISLFYVENLFHIPPNKQVEASKMLEKFASNEGDAVMLLKVFKAFKRTSILNRAGLKLWCAEHFINMKNLRLARLIRKQLSDLCKSLSLKPSTCGVDTSLIRRALIYGLFNNVATMSNGRYRTRSDNDVHIHPSSCLFKTKPECIMFFELLETNKCYMRNCTLIDINWLNEISSSSLRFSSLSDNA